MMETPRNMWGQPPSAVRVTEGDLPNDGSSPTDKARRERRRSLIVPREHGAWGMLLVPLVTGAGVAFSRGGNVFAFVLLLTAALTLFWLRTPVESLMGTSAIRVQTEDERRDVMFAAGYLAIIAALALGMLLWVGHNPILYPIGGAVALAFVAQALLKKMGRRLRMLSEVVGTIGLTSAAPAAFYVITGKFGVTASMLWFVNLLFAGDQIHYVQIRIHGARLAGIRDKFSHGWRFAAGQAAMAAALAFTCVRGWMPSIALVAFVPILLRGWIYFFQKPTPLIVRRLGWSELAQAIVFCILFIAAFAVAK